jgi:CspA family cold shock protein
MAVHARRCQRTAVGMAHRRWRYYCVTARLCRDTHASFNINEEDISVAQRGTVKWFNSQKGFGFIQPEGGGNDVFVHISAVEQAGLSLLNENQKVSFDTETGRNGKVAAVNLKVV